MSVLDINALLNNATSAQNRVLSTIDCKVRCVATDKHYTRNATLYADGSIEDGYILDVYTSAGVMRTNSIPILLPEKSDKERLLDLVKLGNNRKLGDHYFELCKLVKKLILEKE